jgi:hypothetical protein
VFLKSRGDFQEEAKARKLFPDYDLVYKNVDDELKQSLNERIADLLSSQLLFG